jgi:hypothetical protein
MATTTKNKGSQADAEAEPKTAVKYRIHFADGN